MQVQRRGDHGRRWSIYQGRGEVETESYFPESSSLPTSVMLYHLEPGAEEGSHLHLTDHPDSCTAESMDELYVVVRGEVVMSVNGEQQVLRAGDAAYAPAGSVHGVVNESDEPAELVLAFGPPRTSG